ncbi:uncharacterized protein LOC134833076 [Culicoides brevitarsis]|uniref:uncharacterized protein LOC134833076 n=1 Tax=Culicoides brevitarsis TaxID=469753 RepID=UPI00307B7E1E
MYLCRRGILQFARIVNQEGYVARNLASQPPAIDGDEKTAKKKKKPAIPKITLISDGTNIEITTLEEAKKLSSRRNLKLVKVVDMDVKTQRPIYKLLSSADYLKEELENRESKKKKKDYIKGEKLLQVSGKIASGDLMSKVKLVTKWFAKNYEVRVIISKDGTDNEKVEHIANEIEKVVPANRVLQKRVSGSDIRFSLVPPKPAAAPVDTPSNTEANSQQIRSYHTDPSQ